VERTGDGGVSERSVTPEAMGTFLNRVFDEWVRYDIKRIDVQNFLECFLIALGRPASLCVMSERCGNALAVEHDGSVYSCDHFVDVAHRLGNLANDGLAELVNSPRQRAFGEAKSLAVPDVCTRCRVHKYCHGGCPKDRFAFTAEGEANLNYLCEGYRTFYGHLAPYLERMASLARSGRAPSSIMSELEVAERDERHHWRTTGRNNPCPCGSGTKFKQCCLATRRR